jgi:hypothetical protein
MNDSTEDRLRELLGHSPLPGAPDSLRTRVASLDQGRTRAMSHRGWSPAFGLIGAIAILGLGILVVPGLFAPHSPTTPSASAASSPPIAGLCESTVDWGALPTWAWAGFTNPEQPAWPHVMSRSGDIVAILFGYPLSSPPRANINNKILWVLQAGPTSSVAISAQRMDAATPVGAPVERRLDGGFGPSIMDLPDTGCWRLTFAWVDRTDTIDLEYVLPPTGGATASP